jgi:hypothetical protein
MNKHQVATWLSGLLGKEETVGFLAKKGLPVSGCKLDLLKNALATIPPRDLLMVAGITNLRLACEELGLGSNGQRDSLVDSLLKAKGLTLGHCSPVTLPPESSPALTRPPQEKKKVSLEAVLEILKSVVFRKKIHEEHDAEMQLERILKDHFGEEEVGVQRYTQGYSHTAIDIDIGNLIGIEVKDVSSLLSKSTEVERFLGQLILYSRTYERANVVAAICGTISPSDRACIKEIRDLVISFGFSWIAIPD